MTTEKELREKLRKITALFEGATTAGERHAAAAAIERVKQALAALAQTEPSVEMHYRFSDLWHKQLFLALCRRYGLHTFRYPRQRQTTVVVRAPATFLNRTLWPEYVALQRAMDDHFRRTTERIIREEIYRDASAV